VTEPKQTEKSKDTCCEHTHASAEQKEASGADGRPAPFLVAEHPALDALNSLCAPWGNDIEWWDTGQSLMDWMLAADLIDQAVVDRLHERCSAQALDSVADQARELREHFRELIHRYGGAPLTPDALADLAQIREQLLKDRQYMDVVETENGEGIELRWQRDWEKPEQLLAPLVEKMAEILCSPQLVNVKNCEWPPCTLWFLDTTKNKKRRWCTMQVCGNRAKAAAHRAKKKRG
tara:strand:+ start:518 stop:1219 length:702 start_codon:yes stop_codon:yes gene_type:complete